MAVALAVAAAVALAFLPTLRAGLVWDDHLYVLADGGRHLAAALGGDLIASANPAHGASGYYRPVAVATLWVAQQLAPGAALHHATSVLLHAVAAGLLFLLLRRRLGQRATLPAALGALLWALHPANVETVAWVSGRYDLLAGLLAVALLALPWRAGPGRAALHGLLFLAGLLSKEGFLALAPVVVADDLAERRTVREALPRWLALVTAVAAWLGLRAVLRVPAPAPAPLAALPAAWLSVVEVYVARAVAPLPLTISHPFTPGGPAVLAAGGAVAGALAALAARGRSLVTPAVLFLAALVPVALAAGRLGEAPDRYLYVPSLGLAWLVAAGLERLRARGPVVGRAALAAAALAVLAALVFTVRRLPDWSSDVALFDAALRVDPRDPLGNLQRGIAAGRAGRLEEARALLERGREGGPGSARIASALAWVHLRRGDGPAALAEARRAVELAPSHPEARLNLANALHLTGDHAGELDESRRALSLSPRYRQARIVHAFARCEVERSAACEAELDALERDGALSGADALVARVEAALGRGDAAAARERLDRLRRASPGDPRLPRLERAAGRAP